MTHRFWFSHRAARVRVPAVAAALVLALALVGCDQTDAFDPDRSITPEAVDQGTIAGAELAPVEEPALASARFGGGIPIGIWAQPTSLFGERYNGSLRNIWPQFLMRELSAIKARGGKVMLTFAGNPRHFVSASGNFDLNKWKARVARFRGTNFGPYVKDGTIIGHYLIDEPNDRANWNGKQVPGSVVDEMARYSKQLWPGLTTVARVEPGYFSRRPKYLDAAWAQYVTRKGTAQDYIRRNVADAQRNGLALVVGLNLLKGGNNGSRMSASQVESFGSALLASSYPCAFISWTYSSSYLASGGMKSSMEALRRKAENRGSKSCRG